jgi:hypothetical protein
MSPFGKLRQVLGTRGAARHINADGLQAASPASSKSLSPAPRSPMICCCYAVEPIDRKLAKGSRTHQEPTTFLRSTSCDAHSARILATAKDNQGAHDGGEVGTRCRRHLDGWVSAFTRF